MEVILKKDVPKLGKSGEIVKVSDGYARNFLFPHNLAVIADKSNMKDLSAKKEEHNKKEDRVYQIALEVKEKIISKALIVKSKSGGEKLFGSITSQDIANELFKTFNTSVNKKDVIIKEPIKKLGKYEVGVKLHPKVIATVKVEVQAI